MPYFSTFVMPHSKFHQKSSDRRTKARQTRFSGPPLHRAILTDNFTRNVGLVKRLRSRSTLARSAEGLSRKSESAGWFVNRWHFDARVRGPSRPRRHAPPSAMRRSRLREGAGW